MNAYSRILEKPAFGVCTFLGDKMGLPSGSVRLYFIYITCVTIGSPVIIYLFLAFWLNIRTFFRHRHHPVWE